MGISRFGRPRGAESPQKRRNFLQKFRANFATEFCIVFAIKLTVYIRLRCLIYQNEAIIELVLFLLICRVDLLSKILYK